MLLLLLAACSTPLPDSRVTVSNALQGTWVRVEGAERTVFAADGLTPQPPNPMAPKLFFLKGGGDDEKFLVTEVALARYTKAVVGGGSYTLMELCGGQVEVTPAGMTVALQGSPDCTAWNGPYTLQEPLQKPPPPAPPPVHLGDVPDVRLPSGDGPYLQLLAKLPKAKATEKACPVQLRRPSAIVTDSTTPGQDVLREPPKEESGEVFEVTRVASGTELPATVPGSKRYQVIYVTNRDERPVVHPDNSFTPGLSAGRAWLLDLEQSKLLCMGDILVESGQSMSGRNRGEATTYLYLQLVARVNAAIVDALRAVE